MTLQDSVFTDADGLADLVADAHRMPTAMLPRPRQEERRTIDLTAVEVAIPATAASLVDGYGDYGS